MNLSNFIEKFYQFIDKIGKPNFLLIVFILFIIFLTGLYETFSLFTSSDGMDIVDGIKTYQFILNRDVEENTLTIPANSSRNLQVTVSNLEDISLKYGIYYSSPSDLSSVSLGYLVYSEYLPNGIISPKDNYEVSLKVNNQSEQDVSIKLGVVYGVEKGGDLLLDAENHWFNLYQSTLSEMSVGSYVKYVGSNGCVGKKCEGQNANYVSAEDMGYCRSSDHKFTVSGWRIAYIADNSAYLVSAGSPECVCTNAEGTVGEECSSFDTTAGAQKHIDNLNEIALKYCNSTYVDGGVCDSTSAWNMNDTDFKKITGYSLGDKLNKNGYYSANDLMNNGSDYWFSTARGMEFTYYWQSNSSTINAIHSDTVLGIRPIIKLKSSVVVVGGSGTDQDPYTIE